MLALVGELATAGRTIVMATHEMAFAREVADTVCFLDGGRIVESGSAKQVLTDPQQDRTRQFLQRFTDGQPRATAALLIPLTPAVELTVGKTASSRGFRGLHLKS